MTAIDVLRRKLDERGVKYSYEDVTEGTLFVVTRDVRIYYILAREKGFKVWSDWLTPEQAVDAVLGSCNCTNDCTNDCTNSERMGTCRKVYLVETSDDLIESWYPIGVYLNSKAAGDCAEALRGEVDGIRQFARVVELKVMGE